MYEAIQGRDPIDILAPLFEKGWYIDKKDCKLKRPLAINVESPWIYVNPNPNIDCIFNFNTYEVLKIVPRVCRGCFKVVIRPNTVAQLIKLYEIMSTIFIDKGLNCKCGVEDRKYVSANYGGYNYNRGLEQGEKSYVIIRKIVDDHIGSDVGVILKRGCTEMELSTGPSKDYVVPDWADALEDKIMEVLELPLTKTSTPKIIADHTIRKWLEFAWDRGDKTCLEFSDGIPIFPNKIDTYHEEV